MNCMAVWEDVQSVGLCAPGSEHAGHSSVSTVGSMQRCGVCSSGIVVAVAATEAKLDTFSVVREGQGLVSALTYWHCETCSLIFPCKPQGQSRQLGVCLGLRGFCQLPGGRCSVGDTKLTKPLGLWHVGKVMEGKGMGGSRLRPNMQVQWDCSSQNARESPSAQDSSLGDVRQTCSRTLTWVRGASVW